MKIISSVFIVLILILGLTFACLNADPVTINYYIGEVKLPLALLLVFTLIIGALCGLLVGLISCFRQKAENYRLKQRLKNIEREVENLRAIPVKDPH